MKLSVIIPVYNERATIGTLVQRVLETPYDKELIIVDDCSTDGTWNVLKDLQDTSVMLHRLDRNRGKGAAIRAGVELVTGEIVIFQDADLEYDPRDYLRLVEPIRRGQAAVVYGFRVWHRNGLGYPLGYYANRLVSLAANTLYRTRLRDWEVCYKAFRTEVVRNLRLETDGFDIESEVTAKLLKAGYTIAQVPITYNRRTIAEGKKLRWHDGVTTLRTLVKEWIRR